LLFGIVKHPADLIKKLMNCSLASGWPKCIYLKKAASFRHFVGDTGMMPIGPLMIEHRLMDRMIALMKEESRRMEGG
jgi:hypothetical protein